MTRTPDAIRRVTILGAAGRMGRLFTNLCLEAGQQVFPFDQEADGRELAQAVAVSDMVLLAVPIGAMSQVLAQVAPLMAAEQVLADMASVKVEPMEAMLRAYGGPVVGTHPLFGPQPPEGALRVAVTPGRDDDRGTAAAAVRRWLGGLGMAPFAVSAQDHDRAMAYIQGLNFVTHVSYLSAMAGLPDIEKFVTPSFRRRLESAEKMLTTDAALFEALFEANPFSQEAVRLFRAHLNVAAGGDVNLLAERAGWWWRDRGETRTDAAIENY